ncbi:radical SAM protein [Acutalibacter sp. 1XD8-33]|uniref:radical SAM protein n=1 Tax=Acutalibacter sp. 1XD8-33 TaxID=2320081 RepID=UPI000EA0D1BD|nr:radical SAM protein [Acutalibacter sp. 1XD8-33]RKJ40704.1 radical SAM protein [Acutalibacter sp. 1XD8-33]
MPNYQKIDVVLDMLGCPNRCRHCFVGWRPNPRLDEADLRFAAEAFRPYAQDITVYDWNREPDFGEDYREKWALCQELSTVPPERFELASVWRLARDPSYAPWLKSLGVRCVQLTLFGGEALTDWFTGREGAYRDILRAIDALMEAGIAPRLQAFVNKKTVDELPEVTRLAEALDLERRCGEIGPPFVMFAHQGACDGEAENLYPIWPTSEDLEKIPQKLVEHTLRHFGASSLEEAFGQEERLLCQELLEDGSTASLGQTESPVLYVDGEWNVSPNFGVPKGPWLLGNLKTHGPEEILRRLAADESPAQRVRATVPLRELARACGSLESRRLFGRGDYIEYLLNRYCEKLEQEASR